MARDNGSRGSYRHVSASTDEQEVNPHFPPNSMHANRSFPRALLTNPQGTKEEPQQQEHLPSPASSDATATPPTTFKSLKRERIDGMGGGSIPEQLLAAGADRLFDRAPDLLNARFPPISQQQSVPGSLPRANLFSQTSPHEDRDRVTWVDIAIANLALGSAAIGFMVIMYDGASTITGFLWGGIMGMMSH